jgi:hypothetical protein
MHCSECGAEMTTLNPPCECEAPIVANIQATATGCGGIK